MSRPARMGKLGTAVMVWLTVAAAGAWAGPILSTGPYDVTLPGGGEYLISANVTKNNSGIYHYAYTIQNKTDSTRTFEVGLAANPYLWGHFTETNSQVSPGSGFLLHDVNPQTMGSSPWLSYVFTNTSGNSRVGISIAGGQTQTLSFDDPHAPVLAVWALHEFLPGHVTRTNTQLKAGGLPVPNAPEPSSIALASIGLAGLGLRVFRRKRRKPLSEGADTGENA